MSTSSADLCLGCFAVPAADGRCRHCGFDPAEPRPINALPPYTLLDGNYIVGRVLGRPGGFGITYLAFDRHLETLVAIKEYLPRDLATRAPNRTTIVVQSPHEQPLFDYGREQFLAEARTLARLDHPNIVAVRHFFAANDSAYLVMVYYPGLTLADYLERQPGGRLPEAQAVALMLPVLDGLRAVHAEDILHRDIKPANLYLAQTKAGGARPILLDFGAARLALGERSRSLSVMLTPGYAPFEQYHRKGRQGPWTDIYGAAAVLYRMLTGEDPPEANGRHEADDLKPATAFGVSRPVSDALGQGLAMRIEDRPQSVASFQRLLQSEAPPPPQPMPPAPSPVKPTRTGWPLGLALTAGAVGLGLLGWWRWPPGAPLETPPATLASPVSPPFEPELVRIPAGSFRMGSPADEPERDANEGPQHRVQVPAFELGKHEVTRAQFRAFVQATGYRTDAEPHAADIEGCWGWNDGASEQPGSYHPGTDWRDPGIAQGEDHAVVCVSWNDATAYIDWLAKETGKFYRLPSEAEWEYAARAGTSTPFSTGGCITTDQANYDGESDYNGCGGKTGVYLQTTQPVGSYTANPWGILDIHGNVEEWTEDCWSESFQGAPTDGSAWLHGDCQWHVARGGSWYDAPRSLRSAARGGEPTDDRSIYRGLRVARTLTP